MKTGIFFFTVSVYLALMLHGCSAGPDPVPNWKFEEKAITLNLSADPRLNEYDSKSHTLMVVVYQLDDINGFNQLATYKAGLQTLLKATAFDTTVKSVDRFFMEPSESSTHLLSRAQDAKHIAIVTGYYQLTPGNVTIVKPFKIKITETGFFTRKKSADIVPFDLDLILSPTAISEKTK